MIKATSSPTQITSNSSADGVIPARVVLLTNFIPTHRLPIYSELARRVQKFTVLLSTPMESNRHWDVDDGGLDVRMQRTKTLNVAWRHSAGFTDDTYVHVPYDTILQLHKLRPDVIISGQLGSRSIFCALYKSLFRNTRFIPWGGMSEHTEHGRGWLRTRVRKWLLRQSDCALINGKSGGRYLENLGMPSDRIFRFPYAALRSLYEAGSAVRDGDAARRLLIVSQLVERKGIIPFLKSLRIWGERHTDQCVELDLVGCGPLKSEIEEFALPRNVRLKLLGQLNYSEMTREFARSGILAFPTLADDWGMVVNEAMASGLPVLGSVYSQAVDELCEEGRTGWRFRTDSPNEMDAAIERALSASVSELNAMRRNARRRVSHITPEFSADNIVEAIKAALK